VENESISLQLFDTLIHQSTFGSADGDQAGAQLRICCTYCNSEFKGSVPTSHQ